MRWRRVALLSGLFAVLTAAGLGVSLWLASPSPTQPPPPFLSRVATEIEQRAIVHAVRVDMSPGRLSRKMAGRRCSTLCIALFRNSPSESCSV